MGDRAGKEMPMRRRSSAAVLSFAVLASACGGNEGEKPGVNPRVQLRTELGDIVVEVEADRAPLTAANFLRYVDEKRYASASFYRVVTPVNQPLDSVRIEVIQGGLGFSESEQRLPAIPHETTEVSGIRHLDGVISMARLEPGTADAEFFICVGDQPELDYGGGRNPDGQGFAAFGRVVAGMDVVRAIQRQPEREQMLEKPVAIQEVARVR
jgi:peptidyl-prolyl cis-trans isomerase A (cyclophilin A)